MGSHLSCSHPPWGLLLSGLQTAKGEWEGGTGWSPSFLPALRRGLTGGRLPGGGGEGGGGFGHRNGIKSASSLPAGLPYHDVVTPSSLGTARESGNQGPAQCFREGTNVFRWEVATRPCAWPSGSSPGLHRVAVVSPINPRRQLGVWSPPSISSSED